MTDHLPECRRWFTDMPDPDECPACEMFRACEQRVRAEYDEYKAMLGGIEYGAERSWDYALDAAREAVERVSSLLQPLGPALAAIDALREEQK